MAEAAGIEVAVLTSRSKGRERTELLDRIASGNAQIIIGTHALFQESVVYANLTLAVVDEQHRFGVHQRLRLTAKGTAPHMLVMTATPIPRTLVLAAFGDMDVSKLTEKPAGRQPIATVTIPDERLGDIIARLKTAMLDGKKAYWICPLVEDSDESELMSVESRHASLAKAFGPDLASSVALVHGRMSSEEKDQAMSAFKAGQTRLLVATTVIEVGVDVPDATIMVIEHAERFGLAQLHQLRGRVGRGDGASSCILLYHGPLGETAEARLKVLRETEDGFRNRRGRPEIARRGRSAGHAAIGPAGLPPGRSCRAWRSAGNRPHRRAQCARFGSGPVGPARAGPAHAALFDAPRRGDPLPARRVDRSCFRPPKAWSCPCPERAASWENPATPGRRRSPSWPPPPRSCRG